MTEAWRVEMGKETWPGGNLPGKGSVWTEWYRAEQSKGDREMDWVLVPP